jgi:hypothetical protein
MSLLDRVPAWLRRQNLVPGTYAPGSVQPSETDIELFRAAITGLSMSLLKSRFGLEAQDVLHSIRLVRDAILRGEVPESIQASDSWVVGLIQEAGAERPKRGRKNSRRKSSKKDALAVFEPVGSLEPGTAQAIASIGEGPYPSVDPEDPATTQRFLEHVKTRFTVAAAPLALQRLGENVARGYPGAVRDAREFVFGKQGRGPLLAIQQNFPGGSSEPASDRRLPAFHFEEVILDYEKAHPEEAGESTVFDESLLEGQQEDGDAEE